MDWDGFFVGTIYIEESRLFRWEVLFGIWGLGFNDEEAAAGVGVFL